jgi:hypothetical protein
MSSESRSLPDSAASPSILDARSVAKSTEPTHIWRAALLYAALTLVVAYPLSIHPATDVLSDSADTDLVVWLLSWDVHALVHRPWAIFEANTFAPLHHTLAFSENLIGSALFAAPIVWLTGSTVLAMNLVALFSCVACGAGCYLLARRTGVGEGGAFVAGLVFAFAPPRFLRLDQLFLATIAWIPFALAFLQAYLDEGRPRDLRVAAGFFTLQVLTSGHGAVFLTVAALMLLADRLLRGRPLKILARVPKDLGLPGLLLLTPVVLLIVPYRSVQAELGLRRSLDDWRVLHARSFLAAPTYIQGWLLARFAPDARINDTADAYLFPGWIALALAAAALVGHPTPRSTRIGHSTWWWRLAAILLDAGTLAALASGLVVAATGPLRLRIGASVLFSARSAWRAWIVAVLLAAIRVAIRGRAPIEPLEAMRRSVSRSSTWLRARARDRTTVYFFILAVSIWLAIGPPFGLWPYVYWLPGFNFIRASSRFTLMGLVGLAILAGAGFEALTCAAARKTRASLAVVAAVLIVAECLVPLDGVTYRVDIPAADRWLATQPGPFTVAEVPLPDIHGVALFNKRQSTYMLHSTVHWQKTVHGWAGLLPVSHFDLYDSLTRFPDEDSLRQLAVFDVDYLVVHIDLYPPETWPDVDRRLASLGATLRPVYTDAAARVYALRHAVH